MAPLDVAAPDDARGMRTLLAMSGRDPLPPAALLLLAARRRIVVATGFPIGGRPETDGPPGAVALARALAAIGCGHGVAVVSWRAVLELVAPELPADVDLLEIPLPPATVGRIEGAAVAIEASGTTASGARRNMAGEDIRSDAPCFEDALGDEVLVAVGDGGNEVGMASAPAGWHERFGVEAPRSRAHALVACSVSNWGALALVATLGALTSCDLLPEPAAHVAMISRMVARGAVDGFTGQAREAVDGRPASDEGTVVAALRALRTA